MRFGISTHLFHDRPLHRDDLAQVAGYGFESIELFATRSHFDYQDGDAIEKLARWLRETGLELHSVHAPIMSAYTPHQPGRPSAAGGSISYSLAAGAHDRREAAVREAVAAREIAKRIPFNVLVVHLGTPASARHADDNNRAAAVRSLEEICRSAAAVRVKVAAEVIPNRLSDPATLAALIESELEPGDTGICLDFGHAHLMGDVGDAVETSAEHVITTHVHDNHGRDDEHLVPYLGSIDWDHALVTMQKIGYDGVYVMELAGDAKAGGAPVAPASSTMLPSTRNAGAILEEARRARQRFERALTAA
jgi:sugar phosphate isomerase/epimerase